MNTIKLKVTNSTPANLQQIVYSQATGPIEMALARATTKNKITIKLAGNIELKVGDTGAITRAHNEGNEATFDSLYQLLATHVDKEFDFTCSI